MKKLFAAFILVVLTLQLAFLPSHLLDSEVQQNLSDNGFVLPQRGDNTTETTQTTNLQCKANSYSYTTSFTIAHSPN
ncbi:hypothetical protein [Reichenbachiella ulvae]|uniref:Uncharacterized protein n=1 Tax=Reichenbachiella ulvae TaxID=2980104 RepID=A0ABT3CYW4_9BACT|nr:hypothetical protein [Reichenbachiella ulvae]MCV9388893.1 hypothetical protein [Reichenbachiella ulvae]